MQFTISLNPNRISYIDSSTMAHEFGHVIGLDEVGKPETGNSTLVNNLNVYNIMYYSEARVAKTPTVRDRGGARVATGQHSTHTFFTMSHPSKGAVQPNGIARNNHRNACADCRGLQFGTPISSCITFNANGTCALCHTHRGGDVDRNGIYNIADVLEIQKYLAKMNSMINSWETYYLADANGDGSVTIDDALAILKLL
ncbi:MAG: dockerin type I repeat-containing protein [Oscillospiraceae bacterium]|nr:dockerin type I repeat-containing protein [Oscillospiraceae bacterium]